MKPTPAIYQNIEGRIGDYARLWGLAGLEKSVVVSFSSRLRVSLGRTHVNKHRIHLNPILNEEGASLLDEVLCHELAHIVVYECFGRSVKPHGPEWAKLVRLAGFEPRLQISIKSENTPPTEVRFEHLCPVCQTVRYTKRSMPNLRCKYCLLFR